MPQAQARHHERYAPKIIERLVDDLLEGRGITTRRFGGGVSSKLYAVDFLEDGLGAELHNNKHPLESFCEIQDMALLVAGTPDQRAATLHRLRKLLAVRVERWCRESVRGQDLVNEAVQGAVDDAASR